LGQPDYGSVGASCQIEFELDPSLLDDLDVFHEKVHGAYVACRQAVSDELARHEAMATAVVPSHDGRESKPAQPSMNGDASQSNGRNGRPATEKQLTYINRLVVQIRGLGNQRLEALANKMYGNGLAQLTSFQASGLIDTLKSIKDGSLDVAAALGDQADG
jgi:hypothetical protein